VPNECHFSRRGAVRVAPAQYDSINRVFEVRIGEVAVPHRHADILMAKQGLQAPVRGAIHCLVGRESMLEIV